jgi:hypothetical protein
VSAGVEAGLRRHVPEAELRTVTNGCDFHHYSAGTPDGDLRTRGKAYRRIAIYAGNVNDRLDFDLLDRLATRYPDLLFALYGPVSALSRPSAERWDRFTHHPNVHAPGAAEPDRLRDLYAAADVGLIPYRQDAWLVENGLPLKALEMCATGLPVVSTLMKSLLGMAHGLVVTTTEDEFVSSFERTSRATLTEAERSELAAVCAANDYDRKFDQVVTEIASRGESSETTTRVDQLISALGMEWFEDQERFARSLVLSPAARLFERLLDRVARLMPAGVKQRLAPDPLRATVRDPRSG